MSSLSRWVNSGLQSLALGALLAGCAEFPQLEGTVPASLENADYPALAPIDSLLTPLPDPEQHSEDVRQDLESRRAALQDRARRLNEATLIDDETEARMRAGIDS